MAQTKNLSACCRHDHEQEATAHEHLSPPEAARYRRVLWAALLLNAAMFAAELGAGMR